MANTWQNMAKPWQNHGNNMARPWPKHGENMAKHGKTMAKNLAKQHGETAWQKHDKTWPTHGKNLAKQHGKSMAKTWQTIAKHGKNMAKTMTKHGKHIQNGTDRAGRGGTCQDRGASQLAQGLLFPPQATEVLGNPGSRDRDGCGHSLTAAAPGPAVGQRPRRSRTGPAMAQRPNPVANSRRRRPNPAVAQRPRRSRTGPAMAQSPNPPRWRRGPTPRWRRGPAMAQRPNPQAPRWRRAPSPAVVAQAPPVAHRPRGGAEAPPVAHRPRGGAEAQPPGRLLIRVSLQLRACVAALESGRSSRKRTRLSPHWVRTLFTRVPGRHVLHAALLVLPRHPLQGRPLVVPSLVRRIKSIEVSHDLPIWQKPAQKPEL